MNAHRTEPAWLALRNLATLIGSSPFGWWAAEFEKNTRQPKGRVKICSKVETAKYVLAYKLINDVCHQGSQIT